MDFRHLCLLHLLPTVYMTGLIWFVQFAHYPLLAHVGEPTFRSYQEHNLTATTRAVLPGMAAELVLAAWLVAAAPVDARPLVWSGAALLAAIWASTFFVQVPCHTRLSQGFEANSWRRLEVCPTCA